jgi:hypothetical protein
MAFRLRKVNLSSALGRISRERKLKYISITEVQFVIYLFSRFLLTLPLSIPVERTYPVQQIPNHSLNQPMAYQTQTQPSAFANSILSSEQFAAHRLQHPYVPFPSLTPQQYPPPSESREFFDRFLQNKLHEIKRENPASVQHHPIPRSVSNPSPVPVRQPPAVPMYPVNPGPRNITPQKRKADEEHFNSPSMKRVQSRDQMEWDTTKAHSIGKPSSLSPHPHPSSNIYLKQGPSLSSSGPTQMPQMQITPQHRHRVQTEGIFNTPSTITPKKTTDDEWRPEDSGDELGSIAPIPPSSTSRFGERDDKSEPFNR